MSEIGFFPWNATMSPQWRQGRNHVDESKKSYRSITKMGFELSLGMYEHWISFQGLSSHRIGDFQWYVFGCYLSLPATAAIDAYFVGFPSRCGLCGASAVGLKAPIPQNVWQRLQDRYHLRNTFKAPYCKQHLASPYEIVFDVWRLGRVVHFSCVCLDPQFAMELRKWCLAGEMAPPWYLYPEENAPEWRLPPNLVNWWYDSWMFTWNEMTPDQRHAYVDRWRPKPDWLKYLYGLDSEFRHLAFRLVPIDSPAVPSQVVGFPII